MLFASGTMRFVRPLIVVLSLGLALAVDVSAQTEVALPEHPYSVAVGLPLNKPVADGVPVEVVDLTRDFEARVDGLLRQLEGKLDR